MMGTVYLSFRRPASRTAKEAWSKQLHYKHKGTRRAVRMALVEGVDPPKRISIPHAMQPEQARGWNGKPVRGGA